MINRNLDLYITNACNLKCDWCYFNNSTYKSKTNGSIKKMSFFTAKKAINLFLSFAESSEEKYLISFLGGEPLLNFNLIEKLYFCFKKKFPSKKIDFLIFTNGSKINEEISKFIQEKKIKIRISFNSETENSWKKFCSFFNHYEYLAAGFILIDRDIKNLFKKFNKIYSFGIRRFYFIPEFIFSQWNQDKLDSLKLELRKISEFYLKKIKEDIYLNYLHSEDNQLKYVTTLEKNSDLCVIEEMKRKNFIIMPNGDIFSCSIGIFSSKQECYEANKLGNLKNFFSLEKKILEFRKNYASYPKSYVPCLSSKSLLKKMKFFNIFRREQSYVFSK